MVKGSKFFFSCIFTLGFGRFGRLMFSIFWKNHFFRSTPDPNQPEPDPNLPRSYPDTTTRKTGSIVQGSMTYIWLFSGSVCRAMRKKFFNETVGRDCHNIHSKRGFFFNALELEFHHLRIPSSKDYIHTGTFCFLS